MISDVAISTELSSEKFSLLNLLCTCPPKVFFHLLSFSRNWVFRKATFGKSFWMVKGTRIFYNGNAQWSKHHSRDFAYLSSAIKVPTVGCNQMPSDAFILVVGDPLQRGCKELSCQYLGSQFRGQFWSSFESMLLPMNGSILSFRI